MNWPDEQPTLRTTRLTLRPWTIDDAPWIQQTVNTLEIAASVASIPHPYPDGAALAWVKKMSSAYHEQQAVAFAMMQATSGALVGSIGLSAKGEPFTGVAELGYWVAVGHWGCGYATEAAVAVVGFGFETLGMRRIEAHHMSGNPASGKILRRVGMSLEGSLRQRVNRFGVIHDLVAFGIVRSEYDALRSERYG